MASLPARGRVSARSKQTVLRTRRERISDSLRPWTGIGTYRLSLIHGVLALTQDGLHLPAPAVAGWAEAISAHITQSEVRSRETAVRL
jgi:hypothetical protein